MPKRQPPLRRLPDWLMPKRQPPQRWLPDWRVSKWHGDSPLRGGFTAKMAGRFFFVFAAGGLSHNPLKLPKTVSPLLHRYTTHTQLATCNFTKLFNTLELELPPKLEFLYILLHAKLCMRPYILGRGSIRQLFFLHRNSSI